MELARKPPPMRPNTRRPVAAANTAAGRGSPDPACILAENISDRGGDCAKNCTPRNVDDGQLHGPVPQRRTAKRTLDELVAATLLLYPRYLDPVTGLPCPAEVVVARLSVSEERDAGFIVGMRRLQGKFMRRLRSLVQ